MENMSDEFKKIHELKGECLAIQAMFSALWRVLPKDTLVKLTQEYQRMSSEAKASVQSSENVPTELALSFDQNSKFMMSEIERVVASR
ncbi:hypothetical protein DM39_1506 [Burkholderia cenocepacia]|uniref:Uncharacterized protein n=1 Tax=Burkholderia cenocepacia TaxID=95486 RepID=A0AAN0RQR9_9BURK|nr:hypothetical protein DM39_1506 [Burkholderia cenocepacia]